MEYSYNKLRGKIREVYGTEQNFCKDMPMNRSTLSQKLNNIGEFNQSEILAAMNNLHLDLTETGEYFLCPKIRNY